VKSDHSKDAHQLPTQTRMSERWEC